MKKSVVGDPIFWPGLVYSPTNIYGLLFALGSVSSNVGLLFEEFSDPEGTAICRRKTERGWERITAGFAVRSSEYSNPDDNIDLLICWIDDLKDAEGPPRLELSRITGDSNPGDIHPGKTSGDIEKIFSGKPSDDLAAREEARSNFEETVRQLDERIKKLKSGH